MGNLRVISLNVRGLKNAFKRRKVFRYAKRFKADIVFLQETHCTSNMENLWQSEWGNKCLFSNGVSNSCGVAMLFGKNMSNNIQDIIRDTEGRKLICKIAVNDSTFCFANLYSPNTDKPLFFQEVFNDVTKLDCIFNIIGVDFNVVRDKYDRSSKTIYHTKSK